MFTVHIQHLDTASPVFTGVTAGMIDKTDLFSPEIN